MLFPTPELCDLDHRVLAEIDRMRDDLRACRMSAKQAESLRKFLTADAVAASNSIEGFRVSTVDVVDLMEGRYDTAGPGLPEPVLTVAKTPASLADPYRGGP